MKNVLVIDYWGSHGVTVKNSVSIGYGSDISNRVTILSTGNINQNIRDINKDIYSAFVYSATGISNLIIDAKKEYPEVIGFVPLGSNSNIQLNALSEIPIIVSCGAGDNGNETGYGLGLEFWDHDLEDDTVDNPSSDLSSFSNGIIAGKMLWVKDNAERILKKEINWWLVRYAARITAFRNEVTHPNIDLWNKYHGYGKIQKELALEFLLRGYKYFPSDPYYKPLGDFKNNFIFFFQNGIKLQWDEVSNADGYRVYRKNTSIEFQLIGITTEPEYFDENVLQSNTSYKYKLEAFRIDDNGEEVKKQSEELEVNYLKIGKIFFHKENF